MSLRHFALNCVAEISIKETIVMTMVILVTCMRVTQAALQPLKIIALTEGFAVKTLMCSSPYPSAAATRGVLRSTVHGGLRFEHYDLRSS